MKEITVTNQQEWDALPDSFPEFTRVYIKGNITVRKKRENSSVVAWENSSVVARENSSVVARENSSVVAWENSSVEAWGNSSVVARENSSVVAWENSSVVARENSSVVAWENSSVVAWGNSSVEIFNDTVKGTAKHNAIFIVTGCNPTIKTQDSAQVVKRNYWKHTIESFADCYRKQVKGKSITLYKSVNPANKRDFYSSSITYEGVVTCPDFDPNPKRECGGGLHLSPTPHMAMNYNNGLLLKCSVNLKDIVVYPDNISKVRCRKVKVIGEYQGK